MKVRKTHLLMLKRCPRKFKLVFLDKLSAGEVEPVALLGRQFHKEAAEFFEKVDPDTLLKLDTVQGVKSYFASLVSGQDVLTPLLREKVVKWTELEADRWWRACRTERDPVRYFYPLYCELELKDDKLNFEGTIDRVDWLTEQDTIVIEYKPIARPADVRLELAYYFLAYNQLKAEKATHIGWYLYDSRIFHMEELHQNTVRALSRLLKKFNECAKSQTYPMSVQDSCVNCEFVSKCIEEPEFEANKKDVGESNLSV